MSIQNWSRQAKLAAVIWMALFVALTVCALKGIYPATQTVQYARAKLPQLKPSPTATPLPTTAPFDPRSWTPIRLAASGTIGLFSDYYDRFGLRYYREAYPGAECFELTWSVACLIDGEYNVRGIYFPDTHLAWI